MGVDEKALGQRLQKARQKAGLTQQELCQKAGLSYSTLAKIERGAIKSPSVFTVAAIAIATNTSVEKLLNMKELATTTSAKKTSKTGVKFVYFDLNRTLVRNYERAFTVIAQKVGMSADKIEAIYWRYNASANNGELSREQFNKIMSEQLGLADFNWSKYYVEFVEPMPGMKELVSWAAEYYSVGILSGTMPGLIDDLLIAGKLPKVHYAKIIDSSQVKLLKNAPKIFELAQTEAGVAPDQLLLVDDDTQALTIAGELDWQISRFNQYDPQESITRVREHLAF